MFCNICLAIFSKKWSLVDEEWSHSVSGLHHNDLIGLRQSASQSCRICKAIWLECIVGFGKEDWSDVKVSTSFKVVHESASIQHAIKQGCRMELQVEVIRILGNVRTRRLMMFDLLPYNPAVHHVPSNAEMANYHEILLKWYRNCLENHRECRPISCGSYLPSRLVDIGPPFSSEPAKLVTSKDGILIDNKDVRDGTPAYATLSHCWGKSLPLRLLAQNTPQMERGIPRETLPRVFSEAIEVCWQLGIRYLWIDCLCICQDSEDDWAKESNLMGKIYSSAIINIAATGSVDCDGSLFDTTRDCPSAGLISWEVVPGSKFVVVENSFEWTKSFMNQPLLQRAWVTQERLLATRIIHFAQPELIWECRTTTATESYPIQVPGILMPFHERRNQFWRSDSSKDHCTWSELVKDYSRCELTFSKDKLVALSGLISTLESKGLARGCYWAGLWAADLPFCLVWIRAAMDKSRWPRIRTCIYRAPSWSWASLECPVWPGWDSEEKGMPLVSHWDVKEGNSKGSLGSLPNRSLSICIVGSLVAVTILRKGTSVRTVGRGVERVQGISYCISRILIHRVPEANTKNTTAKLETSYFLDDTWNDVVFDDFDERNLEISIWCAPIYECEKRVENSSTGSRLLGLLLEEIACNTFRRVGAFSVGNHPDKEVLKRLPASTYNII